MANMGYCRFENTADDFSDCVEHANDDLSLSEFYARDKLIDLAIQFLEAFGADGQELRDTIEKPS